MRKSLLIALTAILLFGCKTQSVVSTKLDNKSERVIKGDWIVTDVSFPGSDYMKAKVFDLTDSKCFVGSTWNFVSNNNKGSITLNDTKCMSFSSDITWYINKEGNFAMKILNYGKAKKVEHGYILRVANATETTFDLIDEIDVAGSTKEITYKFKKQ